MDDEPLTMRSILKAVCQHTGINSVTLKSRQRRTPEVNGRFMFCYLARKRTLASYPMIGKYINKDHATAIYAVEKAEIYIGRSPVFASAIEEIEKLACIFHRQEMESYNDTGRSLGHACPDPMLANTDSDGREADEHEGSCCQEGG
jgi:hypothetical protein